LFTFLIKKTELENPVHIELKNTIIEPALVIRHINKNSYIMTREIQA